MTMQPVEEVLPREINDPAVAQLLVRFASLIDETVNFGTHVLARCLSSTREGIEHRPVLHSLRHVLGLSDAISLLTRVGCATPCTVLIRSSFESCLTVEFILRTDTQRRAAAFLVTYKHGRKRLWEDMRGTGPRAKIIDDLLERDRRRERPRIPELNDAQISETIKRIDNRLRSPIYRDAENEFQARRQQRKGEGSIRWYSLFGGPPNLERLAHDLGRDAEYQLLYREWSGRVHGTEIFQDAEAVEDDQVFMIQIRYPKDLQRIVSLCVSLNLRIMKQCIDHFTPEMKPEFIEWYLREVRDFYIELGGGELLHVR